MEEQARLFRAHGNSEVIRGAVGVVGGLFVQVTDSCGRGTGMPLEVFFSWMNGLGINIQVSGRVAREVCLHTVKGTQEKENRTPPC